MLRAIANSSRNAREIVRSNTNQDATTNDDPNPRHPPGGTLLHGTLRPLCLLIAVIHVQVKTNSGSVLMGVRLRFVGVRLGFCVAGPSGSPIDRSHAPTPKP